MKKIALIAGLLLVVGASMASAAGINLSWTDCGAAGQQNNAFACNTNTGLNSAVASFDPPAGLTQFLGISSQVDVTTDAATLPDWWAHGTGFCRGTGGLAVSFDFTSGPFTCADFFGGQAAGGFQYDVGYGSPARGRLRIQCAVPFDGRGPVNAGTEYYAFKMNLLRAKTTGSPPTGCPGCTNPACIVLNEIQLFQPPELANDPKLSNPISRLFVTWQNPVGGPPGCPQSTPTKSSTWGQVKSLYR